MYMVTDIFLIIIGAILGYAIPYIVNVVKFLFSKKRQDKICCDWYVYFWWTTDGAVSTVKMDGKIRKNTIFKKDKKAEYIITFTNESHEFKGYGYIERSKLCVDMFCHDMGMLGHTFNRYDLAKVSSHGLCMGLWLSNNANDRLSSGCIILSKNELDNDKMSRLIKDNFILYENIPVIDLK